MYHLLLLPLTFFFLAAVPVVRRHYQTPTRCKDFFVSSSNFHKGSITFKLIYFHIYEEESKKEGSSGIIKIIDTTRLFILFFEYALLINAIASYITIRYTIYPSFFHCGRRVEGSGWPDQESSPHRIYI